MTVVARSVSLFRRGLSVGSLWVLPGIALLGFVVLYPITQVVVVSFTDRSFFNPGSFVGLVNFERVIRDTLFHKALLNTAILLLSVPITIAIALAITGILYRAIVGRQFYEAAIFLPFLPAVAAVSVVFVYILGVDGPLNTGLRATGLAPLAKPWLTDASFAIWSMLGIVSWKRLGFFVLLFQARMAGIDRQYFDAAAIDGAGWGKTFWYVAIPQMRSVLGLAAILGFIEVVSFTFAYVFVLTQGGPHNSTYTLEFLLYRTLFSQQDVGRASAVAVILFLFAIGVVSAFVWRERRGE